MERSRSLEGRNTDQYQKSEAEKKRKRKSCCFMFGIPVFLDGLMQELWSPFWEGASAVAMR